MADNPFKRQAQFLLRLLPHVMTQKDFALKGGTAINLFVRDMPRLSVDIDLTYVPVEKRDVSLRKISEGLEAMAVKIQKFVPDVRRIGRKTEAGQSTVLLVEGRDGVIKIEPNRVIRGVAFPVERRELSLRAEAELGVGTYVRAQILSIPDLYGGKICAALDRQHPRDLFDIKILLENEGLTSDIRKAFIVYLISHDRPMNELLAPRLKDLRRIYEAEFVGMPLKSVSLEELIRARETLIETINKDLTRDERLFLVSFKQGEPQWDLLGLKGVENLPAVKWKLTNIERMDKQKHQQALTKLKSVLDVK